MTQPHCPRAWEIEADRDGRVSGPARNSLELHAQHCQVCSRERRYVDSLARALREDELPGEELAARRLRAVVLDRARKRPTTNLRWSWQVGLFAGLAAAALPVGLWWQHAAERRVLRSAALIGGETWHPEAAPTESGATHADVMPAECVAAPPQDEPLATKARAPHEPSRVLARARRAPHQERRARPRKLHHAGCRGRRRCAGRGVLAHPRVVARRTNRGGAHRGAALSDELSERLSSYRGREPSRSACRCAGRPRLNTCQNGGSA